MESDILCFKRSPVAVLRILNEAANIKAERPIRGYHSKTDEKYLILSRGELSGGG